MTETSTEPEPRFRPTELAPSETRADEPTFARIIALGGLLPLAVGVVTWVRAQYGDTLLPLGMAYMAVAVGLACLWFHANRDGETEVRRAYGVFAGAMLLLAAVLCVLPGHAPGAETKVIGYHTVPWGAAAGMVSLLFLVPFVRHETDAKFRNIGLMTMLFAGAMLTGGAVVAGVAKAETLVGPGAVLALLGVGFLSAYLAQESADDGLGRLAAVLLGLLGAVAIVYAIGRATFPTVLIDGPASLKNAFGRYDTWKLGGRALVVLACVGVAVVGWRTTSWPAWVRGAFAIVGLGFAGVFGYAAVAPTGMTPRDSFLVPHGLILGGIGLVYLAVSIGAASDAPFVVLVRRELAGFFYSPVAYVVLFGMTILQWIGYYLFLTILRPRSNFGDPSGGSVNEPILENYLTGTIIGPLVLPLLIPVLTMRLFSEEKRTGSIEVLLTAPVSERTVAVSKFLAAWLFYLLCWVPMGLFLIALWAESPDRAGGRFDYKPLLGLYVAVATSGLAFIAMGSFFSTLTQNQMVAAVLTGAGMLLLFFFRWGNYVQDQTSYPIVKSVLSVLQRLSYWELWTNALAGQLLVKDLLIQVSMAAFWLFLTVKSLEARKWN